MSRFQDIGHSFKESFVLEAFAVGKWMLSIDETVGGMEFHREIVREYEKVYVLSVECNMTYLMTQASSPP